MNLLLRPRDVLLQPVPGKIRLAPLLLLIINCNYTANKPLSGVNQLT